MLVCLMSTVWKCSGAVRRWKLGRPCDIFREKYDEVEKLKAKAGCMDDLLTGTVLIGMGVIITLYYLMCLRYQECSRNLRGRF